MAVDQYLEVTQVSQNIASNSSVIRIRWTTTQSGGSYNNNLETAFIDVYVNGVKEYALMANYKLTANTTVTVYDDTVTVTHNDAGECTVRVTGWMDTGTSAGLLEPYANLTLDPIYRSATLTASNGTLGTAQTLKITADSPTFKYRLIYNCGGTEGYISGSDSSYSTATSISWTPPLSLAAENTYGTSVSVKLTLQTYASDGTYIGTTTATISCAIPASVKPSCTVAVSDATDYTSQYGKPVQGLSKLNIKVTPTTSYGSPIESYSISADGSKYTSAEVTTGVLRNSGELTISATVKDARTRSGSASAKLDVLPYSAPTVIKLQVHRCDQDGTENDQGEYIRVTFSARVTNLGGSNSARYVLRYKDAEAGSFTTVSLTDLNNTYTVTDYEFVFAADSNLTYDVEILASDDHGSGSRATTASTAFTLLNWHKSGTGFGIGKVSGQENTMEVALIADFQGPVHGNVYGLGQLPAIPAGADFDDYLTPGVFAVQLSTHANSISNMPLKRAGRLVVAASQGRYSTSGVYQYVEQRFIPFDFGQGGQAAWVRLIQVNSNGNWTFGSWYSEAIQAYPVGSIYLAYGTTDPATLFGGTWTRITDSLLRAASTSDTIGSTAQVASGSGRTYVNIAVWRRTA